MLNPIYNNLYICIINHLKCTLKLYQLFMSSVTIILNKQHDFTTWKEFMIFMTCRSDPIKGRSLTNPNYWSLRSNVWPLKGEKPNYLWPIATNSVWLTAGAKQASDRQPPWGATVFKTAWRSQGNRTEKGNRFK